MANLAINSIVFCQCKSDEGDNGVSKNSGTGYAMTVPIHSTGIKDQSQYHYIDGIDLDLLGETHNTMGKYW